ncbi:MAG: sugar ABC transporter permease [Anaerosomatales bacterium]|nr:sugar ABC transporter permease [Anaerosomatales bacterium]MDT8433863.1 sugar ABC transporter permease [Anaerosomatales bacterium]
MRPRLATIAWLWVLPAFVLLGVFLVYPVVNTIYLSFFSGRGASVFVGLDNYRYLFTHPETLVVFRNNLLWLVLFTGASVGLGLILAVLSNQVRYEAVAKAIIFVPMAVSFTAAAVIWRFMYIYRPGQFEQTGVLNAAMVALGFDPVPWITNTAVNNYALIAAGIWMWTGFALVVISAGLKGIPAEVLEAARVDGANEVQIFWRVILPMLRSVMLVVAVTLTINSLKVFDLVYVMTFGNYQTDVLANRMFKEMFTFGNFGRASAVAVVLLLAIIPLMALNIRRFRREQ